MTVREQTVLIHPRQVVLLSGTPADSATKLRKAAAAIHQETGAFVVIDPDGTVRIDALSAAQMREQGWVRLEELEQAQRTQAPT